MTAKLRIANNFFIIFYFNGLFKDIKETNVVFMTPIINNQ